MAGSKLRLADGFGRNIKRHRRPHLGLSRETYPFHP